MKIPTNYKKDTVFIADDEPEHLEWLFDYLEILGYGVSSASTVEEAIAACDEAKFRAYIVDLNIPFGGWSPPKVSERTVYAEYGGLYIAKYVRTQGNSGARVIAYSAHVNSHITEALSNLYTTYIPKGRPRELKSELVRVLGNDGQTS